MTLDGSQGDGITLDPNGIPLAFFLPLGYWGWGIQLLGPESKLVDFYETVINTVGFEVLTAVVMKNYFFWGVTTSSA
jgi:hypothetical protein